MNSTIESLKIAFKSLGANKLRSFLTILSVILGVFTISSLISISLGVKKEVTSQINDLGTNVLVVVPGQVRTSGGGVNFTSNFGASTLTVDDYNAVVKNTPNIENSSMSMFLSGTVKSQQISQSPLIFASTPQIIRTLNNEIEIGRFITDEDLEAKRRVVVLGSNVVEKLFPTYTNNPTVEIRGETFQVIGSLKQKPIASSFLGFDLNDLVIMPITTGWDISKTQQVFRIMMQVKDQQDVVATKDNVKSIILQNHKGEEDFSVLTQEDLLGTINSILNILTAMLGAISAISLVIGGIGIANIMLVSVTERTKEIGIRKSVGATNKHIWFQFLIEAIVLSVVGGIIGLIVSIAALFLITQKVQLPTSFPPIVIVLALVFSTIIGLISGLIPAIRASRLHPIQALRSE